LEQGRACKTPKRNGGHQCYQGLKIYQNTLRSHDCPNFFDDSQPIVLSKAFCWCGLDVTLSSETSALNGASDVSLQLPTASKVMGSACRNDHDIYALERHGHFAVEADLFSCAYATDGSVDQGSQCMQHKVGLTSSCAHCYGESIQCTMQHCIEQCACSSQASYDCRVCQDQHCRNAFSDCSGLGASSSQLQWRRNDTVIV